MDKISLVVTAHRKCFLYEALISVAAQDDKDFEFVLCIDSNGEEGLEEFCKDIFDCIECTEKRIVKVKGQGTAGYIRNEAFSNTTGNWLAYLDGDDIIAPDAIRIMREAIEKNKEVDIFSSGMARIDKKGNIVKWEESLTYYPPITIYKEDPDVIGEPTYFNQFQVMRREVWESYKYDTSSNGEDIDFMLINLLKWKFKKVSKYLYFYRDVENSFSKELKYEKTDFTTLRYQQGFYLEYFKENYSEHVASNFVEKITNYVK